MSHDFLPGAILIASSPTDGPNTGGLEEGEISNTGESCKQATTIDMLPDNVILHIFDFCRMDHDPEAGDPPRLVWKWHRLAHVCQRWRQIVFGSPRRLDLQIYCTYGTPVKEILRCWPALPIVIDYWMFYDHNGYATVSIPLNDWYDTLEALKHPDRVCSIRMSVQDSLLEGMAEVVESPFPVLESFTLHSIHSHRALPDAFLGGYAPRLQQVALDAFPFPVFPIFLRSARDLVELRLLNIPQNGSISAGWMVAGLAALTKLESLCISFGPSFERQISHPDQSVAAPLVRIDLPALTRFLFIGARKYMEEFVAQIETPRLTDLRITLFSPERVVQVPELFQFIYRAEYFKLAVFRHALIDFDDILTNISFDCPQAEPHPCHLDLTIRCHFPRWLGPSMIQLLNRLLGQLLSQSSLIVSNVRDLSINTEVNSWERDHNEDPTEWHTFLRPFTAVETLRTCGPLAGVVATMLEDSTVDTVTEMLPALQLLNLEGYPLTSGTLGRFIGVRQLSGRPVTVDNQVDNTRKSYRRAPRDVSIIPIDVVQKAKI